VSDLGRACEADEVEPGTGTCLAHHHDRVALIAARIVSGSLDLSKCEIDRVLMNELFDALGNQARTNASLKFVGSTFTTDAVFANANALLQPDAVNAGHLHPGLVLGGPVDFTGAVFLRDATFHHSWFMASATFNDAHFHRAANFREARFAKHLFFDHVTIDGDATFDGVSLDRGSTIRHLSLSPSAHNSFVDLALSMPSLQPLFDDLRFIGLSAGGVLIVSIATGPSLPNGAVKTTFTDLRLTGPLILRIGDAEISSSSIRHPLTIHTQGTSGHASLRRFDQNVVAAPVVVGPGSMLPRVRSSVPLG
jgi:Pentapeptide repeats (9 copies)